MLRAKGLISESSQHDVGEDWSNDPSVRRAVKSSLRVEVADIIGLLSKMKSAKHRGDGNDA